jgi:SAM-dependent methyltransferase
MNEYTYKYNEDHVKYMKEQVWEAKEDLKIYDRLSVFEFTKIEPYCGRPNTVLEVGCGMGRGSIFLNHLLQDDTVEYTMADRTGYTSNRGRYNPNQDEYYNDLALTKSFCELNGIKNCQTFDTELSDWTALPKFDLIFSLCSFGMHVSIKRYIDRLLSVSKPTTTMIFGTRHPSYNQDSFKDKFKKVLYEQVPTQSPFPRENWLILQNPV